MVFKNLSGLELGSAGYLEQIELLSPADGRPPIIDPQLAENVWLMFSTSDSVQ